MKSFGPSRWRSLPRRASPRHPRPTLPRRRLLVKAPESGEESVQSRLTPGGGVTRAQSSLRLSDAPTLDEPRPLRRRVGMRGNCSELVAASSRSVAWCSAIFASSVNPANEGLCSTAFRARALRRRRETPVRAAGPSPRTDWAQHFADFGTCARNLSSTVEPGLVCRRSAEGLRVLELPLLVHLLPVST